MLHKEREARYMVLFRWALLYTERLDELLEEVTSETKTMLVDVAKKIQGPTSSVELSILPPPPPPFGPVFSMLASYRRRNSRKMVC